MTIGTVESCTAGSLASKVVSVPGSSEYFKGSILSYANELKINFVGVEEESITKFGAVSQQVVEQMAVGVRQKMNTDYAIATSGIAGPTGGSEEKPVGTVWIAIATPDSVISKKYLFGKQREVNIELAAITALGMLRREL